MLAIDVIAASHCDQPFAFPEQLSPVRAVSTKAAALIMPINRSAVWQVRSFKRVIVAFQK